MERFRVREWIATHRLGGKGGTVLGFHGDCQAPVELHARGLPDKLLTSLGMEVDAPQVATLRVRCRKCPPCLVSRARMWAARARDEISVSQRTWFGTLTLTDVELMRARFAAERKLLHGGWSYDELTKPQTFKATCDIIRPELQKWLKRIRTNSGASLRYLLIAEEHNGERTADNRRGEPHFHLLLHEQSGSCTKRVLERAWRYGFSQFRLVDQSDGKVPYYVTKYLTKSNTMVRPLASKDYGRAQALTLSGRLEAALALLPTEGIEAENTPVIKESSSNEGN